MADVKAPNPAAVDDVVLGGRYLLGRRLATGGMGTVWAATDRVLGREVAIKILRDDLVDSGAFLDRFRNEARHAASLAHSGIAGVLDYGEDRSDGGVRAYLVMELVHGRPLSEVLHDSVALPVTTALSILAQTADALHAAHINGLVHRDVKPGNLLLLDDGTIKVTDFGIACAVEAASITEVGTVLGTARYMSPEQATGGPVTPASDIYSLGIVGYEMLVGHVPFTAANPLALAMAHVRQPPPPIPSSVPPGVAALIAAAIAKDPLARPSDAHVFAAQARQLLSASSATGDSSALVGLPKQGGTHEVGDAPTQLLVDEGGDPTEVISEYDTGQPTAVAAAAIEPLGGGVLMSNEIRDRRPSHRIAWAMVAVVLAMVAAGALASRSTSGRNVPAVVTTDSTVPVDVASSLPLTLTTTATPTTVSEVPAPAATTVAPKDNGKGNGKGKP